MNKFVKILFIIVSVCIVNISYGQTIKQFSDNSEEFFAQLKTFFEGSARSDELLAFHKDFKKYWDSGAIPDAEKKRVIDRSNLLLKKFGKPHPNFLNYYTVIQIFFKAKHPIESYKAWDEAFVYLLQNKSLSASDRFVVATIDLFQNNALSLQSSVSWKILKMQSFTFSFVNNECRVTMPPSDLLCESSKNEMIIYQAEGYYLPFDNVFVGTKGKVAWERSGFNYEDVYAELQKFTLDLSKNSYTADSVWFLNNNYYEKKILGKLEDKVIVVRDVEQVNYPKFQSYQNLFVLKDVYPGITYRGGFTMSGSQFIGSGTVKEPATLTFIKDNNKTVYTQSLNYIFRNDRIVSRNCAVSIYIQKDSIYHPGLMFRYDVPTRQVTLIRNNDSENLSRTPYFNTYHMIDMDVQQITWKIDNPVMIMSGLEGTTVNKASFESSNYFREARYMEIGLYDKTHPLIALRNMAKEKKSETFSVADFAKYLKIPESDTRHLCLDLSFKGLIAYDREEQLITVKPRVYEYLNARVGKIDYDVIRFNSEHDIKGLHNAKLDLTTFELDLVGVSKVQVSDSQNVIFYPRGSQLTMSKNRNFRFDGVIDAGLFTYYGRGFDFNYEQFKINLKNVDSLKIKVEAFKANQYGVKDLVEIKNAIEYITGEIMIDAPNNKSSIKKFPQYPIFDSKQPSYVFYDYPAIYKGVYDRKKFYFKVDPFVIDSLNKFSTKGLFFAGEFFSADIFVPMREKIVVQNDYSFGFTRTTGAAGYPIYKGKGTFTDTINLSFKGLRGFGKINYLNSESVSKTGYTFFPDSTNGIADKYSIKKQTKAQGVDYPDVNGEKIDIHWEPYKDRWVSKETGKAFKMYGDSTYLSGGLIFTPKGLGGWGKYTFSEAQITSNSFRFKEKDVFADTSNFDLLSKGAMKDLAFKTQNVATRVDFEKKKASFKANDDMTVVQFPKNQYICYLNQFTWDMVTKQIELGNPDALTKPGAAPGLHFYSVHPRQDTLNFKSTYAKYDLNKFIIDAYQVPFIDVADSRIIPHKDSVIRIREEAKMRTINNATMYANRDNKYHFIYNATFNINGKLDYTGNGSYDYIDENKDKQTLLLTYIGVDPEFRTFGTGKIAETDNFKLSPVYSYYGDFRMNAWRKDLTFNGNVLIANECNLNKPLWFKFISEIDPNDIFIPIGYYAIDRNNDTIGSSIYISQNPASFYTAFLSPRKLADDTKVIEAQGFLYYDKKSRRYKIGSREKILNEEVQGNLITYHREFCNTYGEGKLNFGLDLGQVKEGAYGSVSHNMNSNRVTFETVAYVDFFFDAGLLKAIADTLTKRPGIPGVDRTRSAFKKGIIEMLGNEQGKIVLDEIQLYGEVRKMPKELTHTFTFSYLDLVWDTVASSYRSVGQIGIHSINGIPVNKMVTGYFEYAKLYTGDMFTFYFQLDDSKWYFFHYNKEEMQFISSEAGLNLALEAIKEPKRAMSVGRNEAQYKYRLSSIAFKNVFVERFTSGGGYTNIRPQLPQAPTPGTDAKPTETKTPDAKPATPDKKKAGNDEYDDE